MGFQLPRQEPAWLPDWHDGRLPRPLLTHVEPRADQENWAAGIRRKRRTYRGAIMETDA